MKTPAAMARMARITPRLAIAGINAASPVRMSQILNNRNPIFFVNLMIVSFFYRVENHLLLTCLKKT
jgi:hypothetical protein